MHLSYLPLLVPLLVTGCPSDGDGDGGSTSDGQTSGATTRATENPTTRSTGDASTTADPDTGEATTSTGGTSGDTGDPECSLCKAAAWGDLSLADSLCDDNGPPTSQQLLDALNTCACGTCSDACGGDFCAGEPLSFLVPEETPCTLCLLAECSDEYWTCWEDGVAVCEDGNGCNLDSEDCTCADCSGFALCNPGQCVADGECTLEDDCTCEDCWDGSEPICVGPEFCQDDGECFSWIEGCQCADCADEPNCENFEPQ